MLEFEAKLIKHLKLSDYDCQILTTPLDMIRLKDPNSIKGMGKVKERIFSAIHNNEKIIIYGDYDCDGISATSIMVKTFQLLEYPVNYYIPSRYLDGYGLNVNNVEKLFKAGFKLIITVDNGISQHDAINRANELGMDVIVVDHHEVPEKLVNAYAIIHPKVSEISDIYGSGGYMSLFVSAALLSRYDDYLLTIAGLSVISDLMELKDYNRDVVRLALYNLEKYKYWPLYSLLESTIITEKSFALDIAPKINAVGRLLEDKNVNLLVKYLTSDDKDEVIKLHDWIIEINDKRKELTREASESLPKDEFNDAGIVIKTDMKEGLIGLIANRLLGEHNKPTVVFTPDSNDPSILKGSARSKDGFNIVKAWESLSKYLLTGGGHALAGGISIKASDFDNFKKDFNKLAEENPIIKVEKEKMEISLKDISFENYNIFRKYAPYGMGFEEPVFEIKDLPTRGLTFISFGKHLSQQLSFQTKLLGFNMSEMVIKSHPKINISGSFLMTSFRNSKTLEFRISDYVAIL